MAILWTPFLGRALEGYQGGAIDGDRALEWFVDGSLPKILASFIYTLESYIHTAEGRS